MAYEMRETPHDHNMDKARRQFVCTTCGTERMLMTTHTGYEWAPCTCKTEWSEHLYKFAPPIAG